MSFAHTSQLPRLRMIFDSGNSAGTQVEQPQEKELTVRHIGIIPDGSRRFAKRENIGLELAYQQTFDYLEHCIDALSEMQVPEVSVYVLSVDNLRRSQSELEAISITTTNWLRNYCGVQKHYKVLHAGDRSLLPESYQGALDSAIASSLANPGKLNILAAYSHWTEIALALQTSFASGKDIWECLEIVTPLDLIIRSGGGEPMLSGFLPMQSAYAPIKIVEGALQELAFDDFLKIVLTERNVRRGV